jgi:hypothetical protein
MRILFCVCLLVICAAVNPAAATDSLTIADRGDRSERGGGKGSGGEGGG